MKLNLTRASFLITEEILPPVNKNCVNSNILNFQLNVNDLNICNESRLIFCMRGYFADKYLHLKSF